MQYLIHGIILPAREHNVVDDMYHGKFRLEPDEKNEFGLLQDRDGEWVIVELRLQGTYLHFTRKRLGRGTQQKFNLKVIKGNSRIGYFAQSMQGDSVTTKCFINPATADFFGRSSL